MLQELREKAQGWIAWVIVILIALTFILFWGSGDFFSSGQSSSQTIAIVNGDKITAQDLESRYENVIRQQDSALAKLEPEVVKKQLLDNLIEEKTLIQSAEKMGLVVSPHRVDMFIRNSPIFIKDGHFSREAYYRFLNGMGVSDKDFKEMLATQLLQQQLYAGFANTAFVVESEIENFLQYYKQKRSFKYTTLSKKDFEPTDISEEEIKTYYDNNIDQFYTPEKIAIEYVKLDLDELKAKYQPEDALLKTFYQDNLYLFTDAEKRLPAHILIQLSKDANDEEIAQAKSKISELESRLKEGDEFELLAKQYSDDAGTKEEGGRLDWIVKGEIGLPDFDNEVFKLAKGEVSKPIKTEYGYHLVKMLDIKEEQKHSFDEVKDQVLQAVQERWAEDEMINLADQAANLAYEHPDSLLPIADKLDLNIYQTPLFDRKTGPNDLLVNHALVLDAAFSDYVKMDANNSDIIKVNDNVYIILRVTESIPSQLESLEAVSADIKAILVDKHSREMAKTAAERMKQELLAKPQSFSDIDWIEKIAVTRTDSGIEPSLLSSAFEFPRIHEEETVVEVVQLENGDYALLWLMDIIDDNNEDLSDFERSQLEEQLAQQLGELDFLLFAKERFNKASIKNEMKNH